MFTFLLASHIDSEKRLDLLDIMIESIKSTVFHKLYNSANVLIHATADKPEWVEQIETKYNNKEFEQWCRTISFKVITDSVRMTQFQKINALAPLVETQYVIFVDDDDILFPEFLARHEYYITNLREEFIRTGRVQYFVKGKHYTRNELRESLYVGELNPIRIKPFKIFPTIFIQVYMTQNPYENYYGSDHTKGHTIGPDFCGTLCDIRLLKKFLSENQNMIHIGTVDGKFVWWCIEHADSAIVIKEPLVHYRTWDNPRSWKLSKGE